MANVFQQELSQPTASAPVFSQPAADPVDNSVANAINAVSGLAKLGAKEYKNFQQDKTIKGVTRTIAMNQQAVAQGKMKIGDADLKDSATLSAAIVANPHLAADLRQAAITVKGTDVTAELDEAARHDQQQAEAAQDTATNLFIQTAAQSGFAPTKPDGSFDLEKMVEYGIKERKRTQDVELLKVKNSSTTAGEREDSRRTGYEPIYTAFSEGKIEALQSTISNIGVDPVTGRPSPEDEQNLLVATTQGVEDAVSQLRSEALNAGLTSNDADFFEAKFRDSAKKWTDLFTGERSVANRASDNLKWIKANSQIQVANEYPNVWALSNSGVNLEKIDIEEIRQQEQSLPAEGVTLGTQYKGEPYIPLSGLLNNSAAAISYGKEFKSFNSQEQVEVYKVADKTLKDGLSNFEATSPDERIGLTNSLNIHVEAASDVNNSVNSAVKFATFYNRPALRESLSKLSRDSATSNKVERLSDNRILYVEEMISRSVGNLKYNPDTGRTGNAYADALLGNIDTFYPYSSPKDVPIDTFKNDLFGAEVSDE